MSGVGKLDTRPIRRRWRAAEFEPLEAWTGRIGHQRDPELRMAGKPADIAGTRFRHALGKRCMTLEAKLALANDDRVAAAMLLMALGALHRRYRVPQAADLGWRFGMAPDPAMAA